MAVNKKETMIDIEEMPPVMTLSSLLLMMFSIVAGVFMAAIVLPLWLPGLSASIFGPDHKAFWYLSRGSAFVSFALLWLSMAFGLIITNKMARVWPGGPSAFDLHQFTSLLGLAFAVFHALILIGDQYIGYTLAKIFIPFSSTGYKPFWVGIGQIGLYVWAIVALSFYVKSWIGTRTWRTLHFASFVMFIMVIIHGYSSGTDSGTPWALNLYWWAFASLLFLVFYRLLVLSPVFKRKKPKPAVQ
jgi:predicted ferric reductase